MPRFRAAAFGRQRTFNNFGLRTQLRWCEAGRVIYKVPLQAG